MNNACPQCGAKYGVTEADVGRRLSCKQCGTRLLVGEEGLTAEESEPTNTDLPPEPPRRKRRDEPEEERQTKKSKFDVSKLGSQGGQMMDKLRGWADVATWVYGIGLVFSIYFHFAPMIDRANVAAAEGYRDKIVTSEEATQRDFNKRLNAAENKPSDSEKKDREKARKEYEDRTKPSLDDDVTYAGASAKRAAWSNMYGTLLGLILLAFGSILYFSNEQPMTRRIMGGVTLLLILLTISGGGFNLAVGLK